MRIPYAVQGLLFAPALVGLILVLKAFCPAAADGSCFADFFAMPIFLPLIALYKIFGSTPPFSGQEFLFIFLYWAVVGFFLGLILDLCSRPTPYSPEQHPPL